MVRFEKQTEGRELDYEDIQNLCDLLIKAAGGEDEDEDDGLLSEGSDLFEESESGSESGSS